MGRKKAYKQPKKPLYHCQVVAVRNGSRTDLYATTEIEHVFRPQGRTKKLTPTNKEIDTQWKTFSQDLRQMLDEGDVIKKGQTFKCIPEFLCDGYRAMPRTGEYPMGFTAKDIETAKETFKAIRDDLFAAIMNDCPENKKNDDPRSTAGVEWFLTGDWNDLDGFIAILKRMKIKKPSLIGQLIFCCWTFDADAEMPNGFILVDSGQENCSMGCGHYHKPNEWNFIWQPMQGRF